MRLIATAVFGCTLTALACGGSPNGPSGSGGTFNLVMKDNPFDDAKAVLVTFSEVTAHRETEPESDFTKLPFAGAATTRTCDLKKLETAQDVLGVGTLPEGKYTQVRLNVSSATLYFDNPSTGEACAGTIAEPAGLKAPLEIPSGVVKLNRQFTIPAGGATTMLIDFDGGLSIHETGNGKFMMRPVVTVVEVK